MPGNIRGNHSFGKNKLSVSFNLFVCHCWICDFSSSLTKLANQYFDNADKARLSELRRKIGVTSIRHHSGVSTFEFSEYFQEFEAFENTIALDIHKTNALKYLYGRGITKEHIFYYNLLYSRHREYPNRIVIPSYSSSGTINFFTTRGTTEEIGYKNPNISKDKFIFNEQLIDWKQELIIVEGPFDYLRLHGYNRTALLGSTLSPSSELFQKIIYHKTPINVCVDPDAKIKKGVRIMKNLMKWGIQVRCGTEALEKNKIQDPGSIENKNIIEDILQTETSNSISVLRLKLQSLKHG